MKLIDHIRNVPDWPKPGIQFKDITTLCQVHAPFKKSCDLIIKHYKKKGIDKVAAIEARGYVWGGVIAYALGAGFILIRKPGKLPYKIISETYELEYGTDSIEMHVDAIKKGEKVLIFDDLLATGGTAEAACKLIEKAGGIVAGIAFVIELTGSLHGRDKLKAYDVMSLVEIPVEE
ncbi:MAG: adenine phosphoribosyltransferase [Candidatus Lokiarchaeota archaeon]|nr:adenine phosphoribosyltransferase [Candidatus Lokiarchaeota archaeon]MBD3339225.1 adenine phosphoribosyltransferase [Candidatus Lokiarchaeota archaeon]